jgi:CDGSH-type Zn-finger protein
MARLVKKEYKGPLGINVGAKTMWICMCGLSCNQHFVMNHTRKQQMRKITKYMLMKKKKQTEKMVL